MSDLETLIQEAARDGRFRGLTLWPTQDGRFQANIADGPGWRVEIDADPVAALRRVLNAPVAPEKQDIFQ